MNEMKKGQDGNLDQFEGVTGLHKDTELNDKRKISGENYGRKIQLAIGKSCTAKQWPTAIMTWGELLARCSKPKKTDETISEYHRMDRKNRLASKDVGGFVGGPMEGNDRKKSAVTGRCVATLDADNITGDADFIQSVTDAVGGTEWFIYSTHSHTDSKPRFRLIVLFSRMAQPDEYEPVCRWIASKIGIGFFDSTTYQRERLMFWPSVPSDAELVFHHNPGDALDVDMVLGTYADYKDRREWPAAPGEAEIVRSDAKKQEDPLGKAGAVGDFCRVYGIHRAVETFLPDIYAPCDNDPDRYTYTGGSSYGGLVVYEDKFAYSNHQTDPASCKLCNSFDLVRIHKFGHLDKTSDGTGTEKLPSYKKMTEFVNNDKEVHLMKCESASSDFDGIAEDLEAQVPENWSSQLEKDGKGNNKSTIHNCVTVLKYDEKLRGRIKYNEFKGLKYVSGMPWNKDPKERTWEDADDAGLRYYMERAYSITSKNNIDTALICTAHQNKTHPVREYLESLVWDGVERIPSLIIDYLGADDNELNRAMTTKQFVAAVNRIMEPGCKFDQCLIFAGPEGTGKSSLLSILAGEWFNDSLTELKDKAGIEGIIGSWIIELGELAAVNKSDVESLKNFISRQFDKYRPAYGRNTVEFKRQCVFFGTTNSDAILRGTDGNRRMWIITIKPELRKFASTAEMREALEEVRDQIWAEAVKRYRDGESLYLSEELEQEARQVQRDYNMSNSEAIGADIDEFLEIPIPDNWCEMTRQERRAFYEHRDHCDILQNSNLKKREKAYCLDYVYDYKGITDTDAKNIKAFSNVFNDHMKLKSDWFRTNPTSFRPYAPAGKKGFMRK